MTTARAPVCARKGGAGQAWRLGQRRPGRHNDIGPERRDYRLGDGADTDVALPPVDILYRPQEARGGRTGPQCVARLAQGPVIALTLGR